MLELLNRFWKEEEGQDLVEYALIIALVALGLIVALPTLGQRISAVFVKIGSTLQGAGS